MRAIASTPLRPGITRSMSTTSGRRRSTAATAASPSPASPTTSIPSRDSRNVRSPCRTTGWSSARNTRIGASATRYRRPHGRACARHRLDCELPAERLGPLAHRREPEATLADHPRRGIEANAVVPYGDRHAAVARLDVDDHRLGSGVMHGVVQRLLDDTVQLRLDGRRELGCVVDPQVGLQPVGAAEDLEVLLDGGDEPVLRETRRPQIEDERAKLALRLA